MTVIEQKLDKKITVRSIIIIAVVIITNIKSLEYIGKFGWVGEILILHHRFEKGLLKWHGL